MEWYNSVVHLFSYGRTINVDIIRYRCGRNQVLMLFIYCHMTKKYKMWWHTFGLLKDVLQLKTCILINFVVGLGRGLHPLPFTGHLDTF